MPTPNQEPQGRSSINPGVVQAAADLAAGASPLRAATNVLSTSIQEKLLGPTAIFAGGLIGVLRTMKMIVEQSGILDRGMRQIASMQGLEGKFTTLLQSAVLAKKRLKELYDFAANSPFTLGDVAEANRQLQAFTNGALAGQKGMKLVGDAAAATGSNMSFMAEQVGKAYNALQSGRSLDRVILNLQQSGLVTDEMAAKLENLEEVGAGFAEKWSVVESALQKTRGGMKDEMQNLDALNNKLETVSNELERAFGKAFVDAKAQSIQISIKATENITPLMEQIGKDIAPVLNLTSVFKNKIAESTLATKGFAEALTVAWNVGKVAFGTVALATVGNIAKNIPTIGRGAKAGGSFAWDTIKTAYNGLADAKLPGEGLDIAGRKGKAAAYLLGKGDLSGAASFAAQAVAGQIATRAMIVHEAAVVAVGEATGLAAARNYVASASLTTLAGAGGLAGRALMAVARGVGATVAALATSPITWIAAAVVATYAWHKSIKDAEKASRDLANSLAEVQRKLKEQAQAATTEKAYIETIQKYTDAIQEAEDALDKLHAKQKEKFFNLPGEAKRDQLDVKRSENAIATLKSGRTALIGNRANIGLTEREREAAKTDIETKRAQDEQTFQQRYNSTDGEEQNKIVRERIRLLREEAAAGEAARRSQTQFDRSAAGVRAAQLDTQVGDSQRAVDKTRERAVAAGIDEKSLLGPDNGRKLAGQLIAQRDALPKNAGPSEQRNVLNEQIQAISTYLGAIDTAYTKEQELADIRRKSSDEYVQMLQKQADLRADIAAKPAEVGTDDPRIEQLRKLDVERLRYQSKLQNAPQSNLAADALDKQLALTYQIQGLKAQEFAWDEKIANAKKAGLDTGYMEDQRQLTSFNIQQAQAALNHKPDEARDVALQRSQYQAGQATFRGDAALERERNRALATPGRAQDAQAVDDFRTLKNMTNEYLKNGLTAGDARKDFDLSVQARQIEQPRVSVDALQAVGGGGFSSGNDYPRRTVALTEQMVKLLTQIYEKGATEGTIK